MNKPVDKTPAKLLTSSRNYLIVKSNRIVDPNALP